MFLLIELRDSATADTNFLCGFYRRVIEPKPRLGQMTLPLKRLGVSIRGPCRSYQALGIYAKSW